MNAPLDHVGGMLDPAACAMLILAAFSGVGVAHAMWLRSPCSSRFMGPLDGGRICRGQRIFGANKTWRGFMVIVPAAGVVLLGFGLIRPTLPPWLSLGTWPLSSGQYGLLGLWAGLGFMAGELPNSFVKRQLGVPPGSAPARKWVKLLWFIVDHLDSIMGSLLALSLVVPVPFTTWCYVLLVGPWLHVAFSIALYGLGVKERPV